jgi:Subtilisin inhibitor-like
VNWTLTCGPSGGSLPDPSRACWQLSHAYRPFTPLAHGEVCSMIDYGPQTATIRGYWYGTWVSIDLSRSDGCQESRWNEVISALGLNALSARVNPGGPMDPGPSSR